MYLFLDSIPGVFLAVFQQAYSILVHSPCNQTQKWYIFDLAQVFRFSLANKLNQLSSFLISDDVYMFDSKFKKSNLVEYINCK